MKNQFTDICRIEDAILDGSGVTHSLRPRDIAGITNVRSKADGLHFDVKEYKLLVLSPDGCPHGPVGGHYDNEYVLTEDDEIECKESTPTGIRVNWAELVTQSFDQIKDGGTLEDADVSSEREVEERICALDWRDAFPAVEAYLGAEKYREFFESFLKKLIAYGKKQLAAA